MKAKIKNISVKITSLIMLGVSLIYIGDGVHASLLVYYVSLTSSTKLSLAANLFQASFLIDIALGLFFLTLASFVWGWKKDWKILGVFICITGLNFLVQSFDTAVHPPFKEVSPFDKMFPTSIVVGFISAAIICLAVGMLIVHQARKTRAA